MPGLGELEVDEGAMSRLGRVEEVGVVTVACDGFMRRASGADGSRGDAMVDILIDFGGKVRNESLMAD